MLSKRGERKKKQGAEALPVAATAIKLNCLIHGETIENAFPVSINRSETVWDLKDLILDKISLFEKIHASDMDLWKACIFEKDLQSFELKKDDKLRQVDEIGDAFKDDPIKGQIHIIMNIQKPVSQSTVFSDERAEFNRLRELEKRLDRQVFHLVVKPYRSSSTEWLVNTNTATLAGLATFIIQTHQNVKDTDRFIFEKNGIKIAEPQNDTELRDLLQTLVARNDTTVTLDVKSGVKIFSEFKIEEVCKLYGLAYDPRNPLSQLPVFECQYSHIDDKLLSYLMDELDSRTALTPARLGPEAHKSIYVYCILHAIAKSFNLKFLVLAERYIEGLKAKGNVDYSIELPNGEILGVTEVKRENFVQGIAQNAMEIRSALEYNRKRKFQTSRCFGIATDADKWYFLEYIAGEIPKVSKEFTVMHKGKFMREDVQEITGIINWILKEGLERSKMPEPPHKRVKRGDDDDNDDQPS